MNRRTSSLYAAAPVWLQNVGITLYGVMWRRRRYGGQFGRALAAFVKRESFSAADWQEYQTARLRELLRHALLNVPFYRQVAFQVGVSPADCSAFQLSDLPRLPLLEKETVRRQAAALMSEGRPGRNVHSYLTSGSTGTPLPVAFTSGMHQTWTAAYEARCRRWAGLDYRMSRATIGGRLVVPRAESRPPFWRYNAAEKQLYLSAFHISRANAPDYARALNRFKPDYLVGYAVAHYLLARFIAELGLAVCRPRAVLTSSEKLTADMRKMIEEVYHCPVFDAYSGVEACCLVSECEHRRMHVSPDVGIVELLDNRGNPVPPGAVGEIVATGLLNFAQPLIRYRTGDRAVRSERECPCGRAMPVLEELVGRLEDTVVTRDGREMVRFHGLYLDIPAVREGQVVQESLDRIRLRLVVDAGFGDNERALLKRRVVERVGPVDVIFDMVESIARTDGGKFRAVVSHVAPGGVPGQRQ